MEHEPLFSIITATYNRAHLLPRAINSVLHQTYPNFEHIIVDDGSTDNTEHICRSFTDPRIKYSRQTPNRGVLAARNKALDMATGDYLAILDDDDELVPEALETALVEFRKLPADNIKMLWFNNIDFERQKQSGWGLTAIPRPFGFEDLLCDRLGGDFWQVIKREVIGPEDRFDEGLWCGEIVWWLNLLRKCKAYYVPRVLLVRYREHGSERISDLQTMLHHLPQLILTNKALLEQFGEEQKRLCPRAYGRRLGVLGSYQIMNGQATEGRKALRESFKYGTRSVFALIYLLSYVLTTHQIRTLVKLFVKAMKRLRGYALLPLR